MLRIYILTFFMIFSFMSIYGQKTRTIIGQYSYYETIRENTAAKILDTMLQNVSDTAKILIINYCSETIPFDDETKKVLGFQLGLNACVEKLAENSSNNILFRCLYYPTHKMIRYYNPPLKDTSKLAVIQRYIYELYHKKTAFNYLEYDSYAKNVDDYLYNEKYEYKDIFSKINESYTMKYIYLMSKIKGDTIEDELIRAYNELQSELYQRIVSLEYDHIFWVQPIQLTLSSNEEDLKSWDANVFLVKKGYMSTINKHFKPNKNRFKNKVLYDYPENEVVTIKPGIILDNGYENYTVPDRKDISYFILKHQEFGPFDKCNE